MKNLYGQAISQKLPVDNFEWAENTSEFDEDFIKFSDEATDWGYILDADVIYLNLFNKKKYVIYVTTLM